MQTKNRSRIAAVVVLLAASLPLLAQPARADDFAPQLTSFTRTSQGVLGGHQLLTIDFTARDEGPAGLSYALFEFETPLGGFVRADSEYMGRAAEGTFTATKVLSPWAASGTYTLATIDVYDREGNHTKYERGGDHALDLPAGDFEVMNAAEDVTAPTLSSVRLFRDEALQGTPVVMLYSAHDDLSGVQEVHAIGFGPAGAQYTLRSLPGLGVAGPASWLVPLASPSGAYEPSSITVVDRAGNHTHYQVGRTMEPYPPGARIPPHDGPDPESIAFTVLGTTGDREPPQMLQFGSLTPERRRLGDVVALDYRAVDSGTGVAWVLAEWTDGRGHDIWATKTCGDLGEGPLSVAIEDYRSTGTDWELQYIAFADSLNNWVGYHRGGRVSYQNTDPGPPAHSFDLSVGDFHLEEGPASDELVIPTSSMNCPRIADVTLGVDDADVTFGQSVVTHGAVRGPRAAVTRPLVAIHHHLRGRPRLVAVVEGDRAGRYRRSFVPKENGALTTTFLGMEGASGADPGTSRRVRVTVRPRVVASLLDGTIADGASTRLDGRVVPALGQEVLLQRRSGARWRTVQRATLEEDGGWSFVIRPPGPGSFSYRAVVPGGPRLAPGRSPAHVLRVTS